MNELWDYKVDPDRFASCWNLEKEKSLVQKINHKKNNFNIDGTNEKVNKTWNEWEQEGQLLIKQSNSQKQCNR